MKKQKIQLIIENTEGTTTLFLDYTNDIDLDFSDVFYRFISSDADCLKLKGNSQNTTIITRDYIKDKLIRIIVNPKQNEQ